MASLRLLRRIVGLAAEGGNGNGDGQSESQMENVGVRGRGCTCRGRNGEGSRGRGRGRGRPPLCRSGGQAGTSLESHEYRRSKIDLSFVD
ncbi:hypothetical protein SUGI_0404770 [Cryptomeria japonica]|nr:hypothetical protein SUGI_0404770 [Cryptomeria japonica]